MVSNLISTALVKVQNDKKKEKKERVYYTSYAPSQPTPTPLPETVRPFDLACQQVWEKWNPAHLATICGMLENDFDTVPGFVRVQEGSDRPYWFHDAGSDVLFVAHVDSVQSSRVFMETEMKDGTQCISSPVLDDRLGVYTLLCLLPALGIHADILLTTDEECGGSTSKCFPKNKQYNWMMEPDRMGVDAVHYQYTDSEWKSAIAGAGWHVERGSYSDIASLGHLGCCGVNIGVAYERYHALDAYMVIKPYIHSIAKFLRFYDAYATTPFLHTEPVYKSYTYGSSGSIYDMDDVDWAEERYYGNRNAVRKLGKNDSVECLNADKASFARCCDTWMCPECREAFEPWYGVKLDYNGREVCPDRSVGMACLAWSDKHQAWRDLVDPDLDILSEEKAYKLSKQVEGWEYCPSVDGNSELWLHYNEDDTAEWSYVKPDPIVGNEVKGWTFRDGVEKWWSRTDSDGTTLYTTEKPEPYIEKDPFLDLDEFADGIVDTMSWNAKEELTLSEKNSLYIDFCTRYCKDPEEEASYDDFETYLEDNKF